MLYFSFWISINSFYWILIKDKTQFILNIELSVSVFSIFKLWIVYYYFFFNRILEGKQLACSRECKFIETSSGIQHNVDELLVGVLKQIRLRETRDKKKLNQRKTAIHGSKTSLSLHIAKEILQKICLLDSKSKSCGNLHVL